MKNLRNYLRLLWESPKDFVYAFTYLDRKKVAIEPYDPELKVQADKLIAKIHAASPETAVYWMGSAALQICGKKDIDLFVTCPGRELKRRMTELTEVLGHPNKIKPKFVEWHWNQDDCEVDVVAIDPDTSRFREQKHIFESLKNNPGLLQEYVNLKTDLNGRSVREYNLERMSFFNRIRKTKPTATSGDLPRPASKKHISAD